MNRTLLLIVFVLLTGKCVLKSQCIDTTLIQYGAYCDPRWEPVCGCDGFTYKNDCYARNAGLTNWYYGICDPVDFDFNPNPPYDYIYVDAMLQVQGTMYVQVYDRFGNVFYFNVFSNVTRYQFQIDMKSYPTGVYYLYIACDTGYRVKKVLVTGVY